MYPVPERVPSRSPSRGTAEPSPSRCPGEPGRRQHFCFTGRRGRGKSACWTRPQPFWPCPPPGVPSLLSFPSFTEPPSGSSSRTGRWRQSLVLLPLRSDFLLTPAGRFPWTQDSALTARDKHCSAPLWFPWLPTRHSLPWCSLPCTTRRSLCFQGDFCPSVLVTLTIMCRGADFFGFFLRIAQFLKCINVCLAALGTCSACFLERFPSPVLSPPVPEAPWHTRRPCGGPAGPRRLWSPLPVWDLDGHVPLSHPSSLPCPLPSPRGRGAHHVSVGFFLLQS